MKHIKHLFVDIEWRQREEGLSCDDILEIAAISCEDDEIKERFSAIIQSDAARSIGDAVLDFLHLTRRLLENGITLESFIEQNRESIADCTALVVWNRATYQLFAMTCRKYGVDIDRKRVVILQDVLSTLVTGGRKAVGFERVLKKVHIKYERDKMHIASYDVERLRELYITEMKWFKADKTIDEKRYISSSRSLTIHSEGCRHISSIKHSKPVTVGELFKGCRICKHCVGLGTVARPKARVSGHRAYYISLTDEAGISALCNKLDMRCQITEGLIFVRTSVAAWRIYHNYEKVTEVFHENLRYTKNTTLRRSKFNIGYHRQNVKHNDIKQVLEYIHTHDTYYFNENRYKNRVDVLLEQIENGARAMG